jgi:hypothetical protein
MTIPATRQRTAAETIHSLIYVKYLYLTYLDHNLKPS